MWFQGFIWKYLVRRVAKAYGFLDPFALMSQLRRFSPPSEVAEPVELLRAGAVFHARGLVNRQAIQHNLDWVWPFWVEQQFDPESDAFLPRAFSITHVNLTHRNWTAVGLPGCDVYPIVDPRGLVTPFWDGWSLDCWLLPDDGAPLLPSRLPAVEQRVDWDLPAGWAVRTTWARGGQRVTSRVWVEQQADLPVCRLDYQVQAAAPGWCVIALRPYNPEGVSFVHDVALNAERTRWSVNDRESVQFQQPVERHAVSTYQRGDVWHALSRQSEGDTVHCPTGLATAAAQFRLQANETRAIALNVRLAQDPETSVEPVQQISSWETAVQPAARLRIPLPRWQYLYESALRSLMLLTPDLAYPGPYTYKRFWYRDAVFMAHALLGANLITRAKTVLDHFPDDQSLTGYFHSQEGEWDSNGEVLWMLRRFGRLTGAPAPAAWREAVRKGAAWIVRKRSSAEAEELHAGLFPPGFSAEHLGNVDYYYWDNFWGAAGLFSAAELLREAGEHADADEFHQEADAFVKSISDSLERSRSIREMDALPASPYRRMDAGAVGSLAAGYPLQLLEPRDARLLQTVEFLRQRCFVRGAFFQDMIHSGMNAYLSLHIAQVLLRAGNPEFYEIVQAVADLASGTGQWPEAIHPRTSGGCMGDGHHAWASAEWVMMMRALFVREEADRLILGAGMAPELLAPGEPLEFGPTPTSFGPLTVRVEPGDSGVRIAWTAAWRDVPPEIEVALPGHAVQTRQSPGAEDDIVVEEI